ncbi:hypothetical protein LU196_09745 [Pantoea sp. Mb-10]|uniref:DUF6527 family protein n=1 Tax=unclassified Pantoea TaxID=2630326 RepID=UPI001E5635C7|nr:MULTISPECIES: DUF6527 family protein [unclassified Pantoea]MCE0490331.1 hypothetical protein [Pantoea sp. Mb-10]MCE0501462.1 hypothetical protein [Pantoea sp. Pb-8]
MRVEFFDLVISDLIPERMEMGKLYVSMKYSTLAHLCACGCENEVITPLSPLDWSMTYNGKDISLHPSIGNWGFPCRSHYWIRKNKISWAGDMNDDVIKINRERNLSLKLSTYKDDQCEVNVAPTLSKKENVKISFIGILFNGLKKWFKG